MKRYPSDVAVILLSLLYVIPVWADEQGETFFESEIRPILFEKCSACHTGAKHSGGLSLESRQALLDGGDSGAALNLEHPQASLLLQAVIRSDEVAMPPDDPLTKKEIDSISTWVELGAPWPEQAPLLSADAMRAKSHWAFQPVSNPKIPHMSSENGRANPIDAFVLKRLEDSQLMPSAQADQRTLARRVAYTLTGLPPTLEQVMKLENSNQSEALDRFVDELLASSHYGEHWARHWLDVARYSDTKGYVYAREERFWVHAWNYRDWVVDALNRDLPYDQFLKLQIAGDQVEERSRQDLAAMGFLTLGRRFLGVPWDIIDDRIDTLCRGTMGLTVACARCHDHKYDPIPTADYYSLYGVFASSEEKLVRLEVEKQSEEYETELNKRQQALEEKLQASREESSQRSRNRLVDYLQAQLELEKYPAQGFDQVFEKSDLLPAFVRRWQAWLHQSQRSQEPVFVAWHLYRQIPGPQFAEQSNVITRKINTLTDTQLNPLIRDVFQTPPVSFSEVIDRYAAVLKTIDDKYLSQEQPNTGMDNEAEDQLLAILYGPNAPCEIPDQPLVHIETFFDSGTINALWKLQGEVDRWIINSNEQVTHALILQDSKVGFAPRILRRGNPVNYGDDVPRQFLALLSGSDRQPFSKGSGRYELAERIASPQNPLTARVIVNRVWAHHFGQGLVTTPSDFGLRAERPSHPELLDWLSQWFMKEGWSLKKLHRLILTSNTYRQSSFVNPDSESHQKAQLLDPENRLLWKMNRHRLNFEEFRDSLLSTSGQLDLTLKGKPANLFAAPYPNRRTLYGQIDRQYLPSTLRIFDFANPDLHIPKRSETTVPQQSLFLLNHPLVLEQVQLLVKDIDTDQPEAFVNQLFQRAFQRNPDSRELAEAIRFMESADFPDTPAARPTTANWQYGYGQYDEEQGRTTGFTPLPHFTGSAWQGGVAWPDATLGWVQLTAAGGHPGNNREHAAIRRWTAPRKMTIDVNSALINEPAAGDGIRAFVVSSQSGTLQNVKNHQKQMDLNVRELQVEENETIDFIVDIDEVLNSDQFLWEVTIQETGRETTWNSKLDFPTDTINLLSPEEQLAHILFCTNEFIFVD